MHKTIPTEKFDVELFRFSFTESDLSASHQGKGCNTVKLFVTQAAHSARTVMDMSQQDKGLVYEGDMQIFDRAYNDSLDLFFKHEYTPEFKQSFESAARDLLRRMWGLFQG